MKNLLNFKYILLLACLVPFYFLVIWLNSPADTVMNRGVIAYQSKDYQKAISYWIPIAKNGDIEAQYLLGITYKVHLKDATKAVIWFTEAANQGDPRAQYELGNMYFFGDGVQKDYKTSKRWFLLAGTNGYFQPNLKPWTASTYSRSTESYVYDLENSARIDINISLTGSSYSTLNFMFQIADPERKCAIGIGAMSLHKEYSNAKKVIWRINGQRIKMNSWCGMGNKFTGYNIATESGVKFVIDTFTNSSEVVHVEAHTMRFDVAIAGFNDVLHAPSADAL